MLTLHSLRLRLLLAMVGIPVVALVAVGVTMGYTNESKLNDSVKFRVIRQPAARGTGLRQAGDEPPDQPVGETALTLAPNTQPILFASDLGQGYLIQAAPGFVAAYEQDQQADITALNQRLTVAVGGVCLIAAGAAFAVSRRVVGPVESLTAAARQLEAGDLTRRVEIRSRDEVGELGHAFNAMAESLERNEALRKTITSDIAHELRTPLNNISGYLDAVADGVVEPDEPVIASLQEEAQLLIRLVNDLEQLSLADAGHQTLLREPVQVERLVSRAVAMVGARAANKGVRIASEAAEPPLWVWGDATRLGQVVRNLLENAVTHTPAGGTVTVAIGGDSESARMTVTDSGPGIPEEHLPYIFERFYRADRSRARSTGGAGLGLAIVKQLVSAHGGTVQAANVAGGGAEFVVMLPAAAEAAIPVDGASAAAPGVQPSSI
jgi:signal transduction histidine kinase